MVFPVEDLGAPPDCGFGALGPSENTPNFLKRRYAAQEFFFPEGARKIISPVREKMGSNPGSNPGLNPVLSHVGSIF